MVAATHALVFAVIYYFTHRMVWRIEGFAPSTTRPVAVDPRTGSSKINIAGAGIQQTATTKANLICKDANGRVTAIRDAQGNCVGTKITSGGR